MALPQYPPVVIILEDLEGFASNVLQDFVTICRWVSTFKERDHLCITDALSSIRKKASQLDFCFGMINLKIVQTIFTLKTIVKADFFRTLSGRTYPKFANYLDTTI